MSKLSFTLNGKPVSIDVNDNARLLDVLRDALGQTGVKEGCGVGECGACTVLLNGEAVNSCMVLAAECDGAEVITVEGLAGDPLQDAIIRHGGVQCGFCTPGVLISARALLNRNPNPNDEEIKEALVGNLCRCTGYVRIIEAVKEAARLQV